MRFATAAEALDAVQRGKADCALVDFVSARGALRHAPTLIIAPTPVVSEGYHVATRSRSADLAGAIQAALNALQADGSIAALLDKWL
jgi:ABC-type amino acid transport substrate-binding protein